MIPLTTYQGLSANEIKSIIGDRSVYIWGSGPIGREVHISLLKNNMKPAGFIDGRVLKNNQFSYNLPVHHPSEIINNQDSFIIIANLQVKGFAESFCKQHGLEKRITYLTHYDIPRPYAAIDISGSCNIQCLSCPQGNMTLQCTKNDYMCFNTYSKVFNKLISDIPGLTGIDLYTWGEPLLNPDIKQIIELTEKYVPCRISTNLQLTDALDSVVSANPSFLCITVNGYDKLYENSMKGASWKKLLNNLKLINKLFQKYNSTIVTTINAYNYKTGSDEENFLRSLASNLKINISFGCRYLCPCEHYMSYCNNDNLSTLVQNEILSSEWDVPKMLELAFIDRANPCLSQRIFPIINWDTSVNLCHTFFGPVISKSYLTTSWEGLLRQRHISNQCVACQNMGLHRLDIEVLKRRYST